MLDLTNQLKKLGAAAADSVDPVTPAEAVGRAEGPEPATDIGVGVPARRGASATTPQVTRRSPSRRTIAAIAAAAAVLAGSIALVGRSNRDADIASTALQGQTFDAPDDDNGWAELRTCESNSDYSTDTGNTFYGAYQLTRQLFRETAAQLRLDVYEGMNPAHAPAHIQDAIANALYLERGADAWPVCGRFIRGPMITPVVPNWLRYSSDDADGAAIFVQPAVSDERLDALGAEIAAAAELEEGDMLRFVSQEMAYAELRSQAGADQPLATIQLEDVPPRFEVLNRLDDEAVEALRQIDDVFEVVKERVDNSLPTGPLRISIPAIGLEAPIYAQPSEQALRSSAALMVDSPAGLIVAGFASAPGSVFERVGDLRGGDTIHIAMLSTSGGVTSEVIRTYEVDRIDTGLLLDDLDDVSPWQSFEAPSLTLVTDVEDDPEARLVLRARGTAPDLSGYPDTTADGD